MDDERFQKFAKDYKIDIRIFVWEMGMQWSSVDTYYRDGKISHDHRQYADWLWESSMPFYGG